jgi:DNA replication factor GINS
LELVIQLAEETITFDLIRKIQREEQRQPKLTKLPDNFYSNVASYVMQKKRLAENKEDKRMTLEIKSIEMLVEDVFNRRERKIINTAINSARTGIPPENMIDEEMAFYQGLLSFIKTRRNDILKNIMNEPEIKEEMKEKIEEETKEKMKPEEKTKETAIILSSTPVLTTTTGITAKDLTSLIVFKEDVPSFMGADLKQYGPFKKGDIAKVPDENMRVLIDRGVVEEFKVSKD